VEHTLERPPTRCPDLPSDLVFRVDLWGRLSNPPNTLELASHQGFLGGEATVRRSQKAAKRSGNRPGAVGPDNRGRLSNPASRVLNADDKRAHSPIADRSAQDPGPPVQRRLTPSELEAVVVQYQSGRSLKQVAREFSVHHRTVADHLERLGIARRVNPPKLTAADVKRAVARYRAGDSLATVGKALNVDASTVQRALNRAGESIRPRPGY
jgi:transposase-like protein